MPPPLHQLLTPPLRDVPASLGGHLLAALARHEAAVGHQPHDARAAVVGREQNEPRGVRMGCSQHPAVGAADRHRDPARPVHEPSARQVVVLERPGVGLVGASHQIPRIEGRQDVVAPPVVSQAAPAARDEDGRQEAGRAGLAMIGA